MQALGFVVTLALVIVALKVVVQRNSTGPPCTQADLDRPAPSVMPVAQRVEHTLRLHDARVSPPPPGVQPAVPAEEAWKKLQAGRLPVGGGGDEQLLFGIFSIRHKAPMLAWALYTRHRAQKLEGQPQPPDVRPLPGAKPCYFVTVLDGLDATSGNGSGGEVTTES